MIYDAKKGYGLKLTKFDEQYDDCIIYRSTKEGIIRLADNIMRTFDKRGLLDELNEMQSKAKYKDEDGEIAYYQVFDNKFAIPSYFINLLLEKHNMKVLGW